jgi:hypothetical protein
MEDGVHLGERDQTDLEERHPYLQCMGFGVVDAPPELLTVLGPWRKTQNRADPC